MTDAADRRRDVIVAGHRGDTAVPRQHLHDPEPDVRAAALGALSRLDDLDSAVLDAALADESPVVRRRAATVAATTTHGDLLALLSDPDDSVIETAAWACGERTAESAIVDRLIAIVTDHEEPLCREAAVAALGSLEAEAAVPAIVSACSDKPQIRRRAVLALAPFDTPETADALQAALEDRDWQVRQAAEELLEIESADPELGDD